MIRVNAAYFYDLAVRVHPITALEDDDEMGEIYGAIYFAERALRAALLSDVIPLRTSIMAGWALVEEMGKVSKALDESLAPAPGTNPELIGLYSLKLAAQKFETVLAAELQIMDVYFVSQKALYSTTDLVERTELIFPEAIRSKVSDEALADVQQAGKCLAFDVATAAGFHILRATESVIREYLALLTGATLAKKSRNWGAYIRELGKHGADAKVVLALQQIKDMHRNPIMHPEVTLTTDEAIGIFGIAQGVIVAMVTEMEAFKAAVPPVRVGTIPPVVPPVVVPPVASGATTTTAGTT